MPQYKRTQYGLKQYGTFIPTTDPQQSGRWRFVRARFGVRQNGQTFWLYQHTPVQVNSRVKRIRLRDNTGDSLTETYVTRSGYASRVRLTANTGDQLTAESIRNQVNPI